MAGETDSPPEWVLPEAALEFRFSRGGGPGGQNVNKVSSRVELLVTLAALGLPTGALARLTSAERGRISNEGVLRICSTVHRDQPANREACVEKLRGMLARALRPPAPRLPTRTPRRSRAERLDSKRRRGATKATRRSGAGDEG